MLQSAWGRPKRRSNPFSSAYSALSAADFELRLEQEFGPLRGMVLLAILWTAWHLPLFLYKGRTSSPLWIYALILTGVSVILSLCTNLASFSVIPAIATHAAFNTVADFLNDLFVNVQPTARISLELVMALCGLAIAGLLIFATRGRLAYRKDS